MRPMQEFHRLMQTSVPGGGLYPNDGIFKLNNINTYTYKDMTINTSPAFRVYSFIIPASDITSLTGNEQGTNGVYYNKYKKTAVEIAMDIGSGAPSTFIFGVTVSVFLKNTSNTTISGANSLDTTGITASCNVPGTQVGTENWNFWAFTNNFVWDGSSNIQIYLSTKGTQSIANNLGFGCGTSSGYYWAHGVSDVYPITAAPGLTGTDRVAYQLWLQA